MLFNEPKLLKSLPRARRLVARVGFSALQRAEIAEMRVRQIGTFVFDGFSALQRAEIAEIRYARTPAVAASVGFSALQRAEIAEI